MNNELYQPARLSLAAISRELSVSRDTVRSRMQNTEPATDGTYSMQQVCDAFFGSLHKERLRIMRAQAEMKETELAMKQRRLIDVTTLGKIFEDGMFELMRVAHESHMSDAEIDAFRTSGQKFVNQLGEAVYVAPKN